MTQVLRIRLAMRLRTASLLSFLAGADGLGDYVPHLADFVAKLNGLQDYRVAVGGTHPSSAAVLAESWQFFSSETWRLVPIQRVPVDIDAQSRSVGDLNHATLMFNRR